MAEYEGTSATGKVVSDSDFSCMQLPLPGTAPLNSDTTNKVGITRRDMLMTSIKMEYDIFSRQKNASKCFASDMQSVVDKCWLQIHPKLMQVVESENQGVLEEFKVMDRVDMVVHQLSHMESVNSKIPACRGVEDHIKCELIGGGSRRHLNTFSNLFIVATVDCTQVGSATASLEDLVTLYRRPTGIPQEDFKQNTDVGLRESIPKLERLLTEVQKITAKLQVCISERQHKLLALGTQINDKIEELERIE